MQRWIELGMCCGLAACASDPVVTADAAMPAMCEQQALIDRSAARWQALSALHDGSYSYVDLNCVANATNGQATEISVRDGEASIAGSRSVDRAECSVWIDRYADFTARTFEQLHEACSALLALHCEQTTLDVDDQGVLRTCSYRDDSDCNHGCGEGFYIQSWTWDEP